MSPERESDSRPSSYQELALPLSHPGILTILRFYQITGSDVQNKKTAGDTRDFFMYINCLLFRQ